MPDDDLRRTEDSEATQTKRDLQQPIGRYSDGERTWLSPESEDPLRDEAAERAARAVEPSRPRE